MTIPPGWLEAPAHKVDVWSEHLAEPICVGRLSVEVATGMVLFEWSAEARERQIELSPLLLPLSDGVWLSRSQAGLPIDFQGLPGLLNDALPDGWGLYLMNKALDRAGVAPAFRTPAARLAFLGDRAWGSLSFLPAIDDDDTHVMTLEALGREMGAVIEGHLEAVSNEMLQAGSSPQGARPKVMVDCDEAFQHARVTAGTPPAGYRSWLIKFASRDEPEDAPLMEQVYMELARDAGLRVMDSRLLDLNGRPAFATERFDRGATGRLFTHTLGGLLNFSHRDIGLDYANLAQVMQALRVPAESFTQAYSRAAFNAAMSVRDDHAKNFAFVKGRADKWDISPAYDLTYMTGPGGFHTMTFAEGRGRDPTKADLLRLAPYYGVSEPKARLIIESMVDVAQRVRSAAQALGVRKSTWAPAVDRLAVIGRSLA